MDTSDEEANAEGPDAPLPMAPLWPPTPEGSPRRGQPLLRPFHALASPPTLFDVLGLASERSGWPLAAVWAIALGRAQALSVEGLLGEVTLGARPLTLAGFQLALELLADFFGGRLCVHLLAQAPDAVQFCAWSPPQRALPEASPPDFPFGSRGL